MTSAYRLAQFPTNLYCHYVFRYVYRQNQKKSMKPVNALDRWWSCCCLKGITHLRRLGKSSLETYTGLAAGVYMLFKQKKKKTVAVSLTSLYLVIYLHS